MLGFVHENCQLGHLGPELVGDLAPLDLRAVRPGRRRWRGGRQGQQVAGEVPRQRCHVAPRINTSFTKRAQELGPETRRSPCPGPRGGPWSLITATETMRPVGAPSRRWLEPQIGPVVQRSSLDLIVVSPHSLETWLLETPDMPMACTRSSRAGRHALDVGLLDHSRPSAAAPEARQLRDLQCRAGPGLPIAVAVAVGDTIRRALAVSRPSTSSAISRSAVKPIISRSRSASELRAQGHHVLGHQVGSH